MGRATAHCFGLAPGPWRGIKRSNIIKLQLQSQFQLCVFIQIKDIKYIKWNSVSVASDMHKELDLGSAGWTWGVLGVKYFSFAMCDGTPVIDCVF